MALKNFRAPPLAYPSNEYRPEQMRAMIRTLELVFSQWDSFAPNQAESYTADYFYGGVFFESSASFTADGTIGATTSIALVDASAGTVTLDLPAASTAKGRVITVKKVDTTPQAVVIDGSGSETIDGGTTATITTPYVALKLFCDGTEWWIV